MRLGRVWKLGYGYIQCDEGEIVSVLAFVQSRISLPTEYGLVVLVMNE